MILTRQLIFLLAATLVLVSGCCLFSDNPETIDAPCEDNGDEIGAYAIEIFADDEPANTGTSLRVADRPSSNFDERTLPVSLIVLHYTAANLKNSLAVLRNGSGTARVSSHYLISKNGTIFRLVDESKRAWHAGVSEWKGITDVNSASIGIEIVNLGHDKHGRPTPYTKEQIEATINLCLDIQSRYQITDVVGHSDVAPKRKIDPGELFPWRTLYDRGVKVGTTGFVPPLTPGK